MVVQLSERPSRRHPKVADLVLADGSEVEVKALVEHDTPDAVRSSGESGLLVTIQFGEREGRQEPVAVMVSTRDGSPISSTLMRGLPFAAVVESARAQLASAPALPLEADHLVSTPGERYTRVAQVYRAAWERGERPTAAVAAAFGVTSKHASTLVRRARERGLLPATTQGRATARRG